MKYKKLIFAVITIMLLLSTVVTPAFAESTGFTTESLPQDQIDTIRKNTKITMLTNEPRKQGIECFDVNEKGIIAIGCGEYTNKTVSIYTTDGIFKYAYSFVCYGSFGVELDGEILTIYFMRSSIAVSVDTNGEIIDVVGISDTYDNYSYWDTSVWATKRSVGDTDYVVERDLGPYNLVVSSYSRLIVTDSTGSENIIYDVNSSMLVTLKVRLALFCGFFVLVIICVIWKSIKSRRGGW